MGGRTHPLYFTMYYCTTTTTYSFQRTVYNISGCAHNVVLAVVVFVPTNYLPLHTNHTKLSISSAIQSSTHELRHCLLSSMDPMTRLTSSSEPMTRSICVLVALDKVDIIVGPYGEIDLVHGPDDDCTMSPSSSDPIRR